MATAAATKKAKTTSKSATAAARTATKRKKAVAKPTEHHITTEPAAFLKEVDEHLHYEAMKEMWHKYKTALFIALIALFVAVGSVTYYNQNKERTLSAHAATWWEATQIADMDGAKAAMASLAETGDIGHRILSRIQLAKMAIIEGNTEAAIAELRAIKADKDVGVIYRDMASFFEAQAIMATNPAKAKTLLTEMDNSGSPFKWSALDMLAIMAENAGNNSEAVALYERIAEAADATPLMRSRAKSRITALTGK